MVDLIVVLSLDAKFMPMLKLFELKIGFQWRDFSFYANHRRHPRSEEGKWHFLHYFSNLTSRFEQWGSVLWRNVRRFNKSIQGFSLSAMPLLYVTRIMS
jgi:hypothetical protein